MSLDYTWMAYNNSMKRMPVAAPNPFLVIAGVAYLKADIRILFISEDIQICPDLLNDVNFGWPLY